MKKTSILFFLVSLFFAVNSITAQNTFKGRSIGIQLNPYLDSHFFEGTFLKPVFAGRFTFHLNDHLSFGPEVSGYFVHWISDQGDMDISDLKFGAFARYSVFRTSRINPFIELSPYYSFHHLKSATIVTYEGIGMDKSGTYFSGYFSPGVTLSSKNHKFSLDLMYKFSDKEFVNSNKSVFSYRLNFHF